MKPAKQNIAIIGGGHSGLHVLNSIAELPEYTQTALVEPQPQPAMTIPVSTVEVPPFPTQYKSGRELRRERRKQARKRK